MHELLSCELPSCELPSCELPSCELPSCTNYLRVQTSKNPTIFTVLFVDTAAMAGLVVAFLGIFLSDILNQPVFGSLW